MGRVPPDRPRGIKPPPPPAPPAKRLELGTAPLDLDACTKAYVEGKTSPRRLPCSYCGRGGLELTQCEGCGAPLGQVEIPARSATVKIEIDGRAIARAMIPAFPTVKR